MSASASKKKRKEQSLLQVSDTRKEQKASTGKKFLIGIVAAVVAVALIITVGMLVKSTTYKVTYDINQPAMTVGDYEVSVPMFNYFYTNVLNNYLNSGYLNYGLITQGVPLSQQPYMGSLSGEDSPMWSEQLISETKTQISNTVNLYLAAKEAGHTLTEEDYTAIDASVASLKDSAKQSGYNFFGLTTNWFIADYFGLGCNMENYRSFAELSQYCASYMEVKEADFEPTEEEIAAEYAENPNDYDLVSYTLYIVNAEADGKDENDNDTFSDEAIAAAKDKAQTALKAFPTEGVTEATNSYANVSQSVNSEVAEWLFASARKEGDISTFASEDEKTNYVVRFDAREDNNYHQVNAYVISFAHDAESAEHDHDAESAEHDHDHDHDELTAAEKYSKLCDGLTNGISEEDFTALAEEYGFTATSRAIGRYTYSDEINAFLFDSARKDGDIFTLADEDTSAYYVIRFVSVEETLYQTYLVEEALHHEAEDAWLHEVYAVNTAEADDAAIANAYTDRIYG